MKTPLLLLCCALLPALAGQAQPNTASKSDAPELPTILTPSSPAEPRINGPTIFGVRPGSPFLYAIPATGERPMSFSVEGLPKGLSVDASTGRMTGTLSERGEYAVLLRARNAKGVAEKKFRIVVGDRITLTPPMGWNSWNCWAAKVSQEKMLRSARALVDSGLSQHGWTYVNIDDGWQGKRGGASKALEGNEKFPDLGGLAEAIHRMGLKIGIYSTPWKTSYAKFPGGSSNHEDGAWDGPTKEKGSPFGQFSFVAADARQWAQWGIDYLKYDWDPIDVPHVEEMSKALRASGRDIVFSLSNSAPFVHAADWARLAECWRTTGDIVDLWDTHLNTSWYSVSEIGFSQDAWAPFAGPGHWNDPDMLVVGKVGWGTPHESRLTPDEQYAHLSLWCMLSAPLLLGCDLEQLTPFTLGLLTNDEVLAIDQDALGRQAVRVATLGDVDIYVKELEDGSRALGFFNRGESVRTFTFDKLQRIGMKGKQNVRDLWRQKDLGTVNAKMEVSVPAHGVCLYKMTPAAIQ